MIPEEQYPDGPYRPSHWPEWARDEIFIDVTAHLDWTDRLLVLIGRPVGIRVRTVVGTPPGRCASESSVSAHRIHWPWQRQHGGYSPAPASSDQSPGQEGQGQ